MTRPSWLRRAARNQQRHAIEQAPRRLRVGGRDDTARTRRKFLISTGAGADAAANYGRRSPIPMINILRTPQVKAAQKGLPTGLVYSQNEETLGDIGTEQLEEMLRTLD